MKLSIITICYNIKDEIRRTCESIANQTWQDFEWIVVDGGSTDGTIDILNEYKDRINIFISEKDKGRFDAMNKGILKANGEFLIFMNGGDTFFDINVLSNIFPNKDYSSYDVLYGQMNYKKLNKKSQIISFPHDLNSSFFIANCINHQSTFIKKILFDKYGLYEDFSETGGDVEKWLCFLKNGCKFKYLDYLVGVFYEGGISSYNTEKSQQNHDRILRKYFTPEEIISYKKDNKHTTKKYYLLGFIPLIAIKKKPDYVRIKFLGIPVLKIKET